MSVNDLITTISGESHDDEEEEAGEETHNEEPAGTAEPSGGMFDISQSDIDFLVAEAENYQEGTDASDPGMISKEEWDSIWSKFPAEGLRDMVSLLR